MKQPKIIGMKKTVFCRALCVEKGTTDQEIVEWTEADEAAGTTNNRRGRPLPRTGEKEMRVDVKMEIKCPRVPNFVQRTDGKWEPLCALSDEGLKALAAHWLEALRARVKEQKKDAEFFYRNASKGEV